MSEKVEGKPEGGARQADPAVERGAHCGAGAADAGELANALRFEQAKNKVLLDEVIALEDEVVNRCMEDFDAVVSDETREFWREQLLTNREAATTALSEMARAKQAVGPAARRPLHNRALARPVAPAAVGGGGAGEADDRAARIRNRAHEIARAERVPFSAAFRRAEGEMRG